MSEEFRAYSEYVFSESELNPKVTGNRREKKLSNDNKTPQTQAGMSEEIRGDLCFLQNCIQKLRAQEFELMVTALKNETNAPHKNLRTVCA